MIPAPDVDLASGWSKCRECNDVFSFRTTRQPRTKEIPLPAPKGVHVEESSARLAFSRRWFSFIHVFLIVFCVIWWGFLFVWYGIGFALGNVIMLLFPILHVAAGIGLGYYTLAGLLNHTTVVVTQGKMTIAHSPLPWPGNRTIPTGHLRQLYCRRHEHHGENGVSHSYSVDAITTAGTKLKLLSGLGEAEDALFFEKKIERYLGIPDEPVPGGI